MDIGATILRLVLKTLLPRAPEWVALVLLDLIPDIVETAREVLEDHKLKGPEVILRVRSIIDDALDALPAWQALGEERRDVILDGLTQLALWLYETAADQDGKVTPARVKKVTAKVKRHVRREA